jgi:16S rRNA (guanine966-N2)-methyltransferase
VPEAGRVIAGSVRGVRLLGAGEATRPLSDRVKESLFATLESTLAAGWPAVPFLDLFAGTGAAGIEALSRGAPRAHFVERDERAVEVIRENLRRTHLTAGVVVHREALAYLGAGARDDGRFGAVLLDPPYADGQVLAAALVRLGDPELGWLRDDSIVVAKHFWRDAPPERAGSLARERTRRYGETAVTFYRLAQHREESPEP